MLGKGIKVSLSCCKKRLGKLGNARFSARVSRQVNEKRRCDDKHHQQHDSGLFPDLAQHVPAPD